MTVPVGISSVSAINRSATRQPVIYAGGNETLLDTSAYFGDLIHLTVNRSGGKCQIGGFVYVENIRAVAYNSGGGVLSGNARKTYCGLILYRDDIPIFYARVAASVVVTGEVAAFYGAVSLPSFIDSAGSGSTTYKLRIGLSTPIPGGGIQLSPWEAGSASVLSASLSVLELKK